MRRKIQSFAVSLFLIIATFAAFSLVFDYSPNVKGATLYVGGFGPGNFSTIQEAINAANNGDTVFVYSGTYYEKVNVDKTINLTGENRDTTMIDSGGDTVKISEDWVNITGFTIKHPPAPQGNAGLRVDSNYNNISGNKVNDLYIGIHLRNSRGNNIINNEMSKTGIYITGNHVEHWNTHNIDTSNTVDGKTVYYWKNQIGGIIPIDAGQVILANCTNVIVTKQDIHSGSCGIELGFSSNNEVTGNIISSTALDGITLYYSNMNLLTNNTISESHVKSGIYVESSNMNDITNNTVFSHWRSGIYVNVSSYNKIVDNQISDTNNAIFLHNSEENLIIGNTATLAGFNGIHVYYSSNNTIENNTCNLNDFAGISIRYSHYNIMNNNTCNSNWRYGVELSYSEENIIRGNTLLDNANGIRLHTYSNNNNILNNKISGSSWSGIHLEPSAFNNIVNNNITSSAENGIDFEMSSSNNIMNNNITSNGENGIYFIDSIHNKIVGNNISDNTEDGIRFFNSPENKIIRNNVSNNSDGIQMDYFNDGIDIEDNVISSNSENGIYIYWDCNGNNITANRVLGNGVGINISAYSNNNTIIANNVFNNSDGIFLHDAVDNSIYHNNIINNTNQAFDNTNNSNQWDDGYPSGGNFWSDYTGLDIYNGPNQDILGSDGIGDDPYVIDLDSQDDYPLWEPYSNFMVLKPGWNLISIPLIQEDEDLTKVLELIDGYYDAVQWYDITDSNDHWKHHHINKLFGNDLSDLNETMGFWIYITAPGDIIFFYLGTKPTMNQKIALYPGWNLVGYPSLSNKPRDTALNNIIFGTDVDAIQTYDAATGNWEVLGPSDDFELGRGYWVHSLVEKVWEVPL
jgi:parallel beta-helix repeat protein